MKQTILVTGSKGQLGNEIQAAATNYPSIEIIPTDLDILDITNMKDLRSFVGKYDSLDYLVNCAAYTAVDKAEDEPELATTINTSACHNLAAICKENNIRLIHVSTDYVFDGTQHVPYVETDPCSPNSVYGQTKRDGEKQIEAMHIEHLILRTSWLYSSYGNNFVKTMLRLSAERDELKVLFDQIGTPTYAKDLAFAILHIISECQSNLKFKKGIYHYSNEGVCSWYDFAHHIIELSSNTCSLIPIRSSEFPQKANRPSYSVLDKRKIKQTYNIQIPYWRDSLKDCMLRL